MSDLRHNYLKRTEAERREREGVDWRLKAAEGLGWTISPGCAVSIDLRGEWSFIGFDSKLYWPIYDSQPYRLGGEKAAFFHPPPETGDAPR